MFFSVFQKGGTIFGENLYEGVNFLFAKTTNSPLGKTQCVFGLA